MAGDALPEDGADRKAQVRKAREPVVAYIYTSAHVLSRPVTRRPSRGERAGAVTDRFGLLLPARTSASTRGVQSAAAPAECWTMTAVLAPLRGGSMFTHDADVVECARPSVPAGDRSLTRAPSRSYASPTVDWRAKYLEVADVLADTRNELDDFHHSSKELEEELERELERAEKAQKDLKHKVSRAESERDEWKVCACVYAIPMQAQAAHDGVLRHRRNSCPCKRHTTPRRHPSSASWTCSGRSSRRSRSASAISRWGTTTSSATSAPCPRASPTPRASTRARSRRRSCSSTSSSTRPASRRSASA
jgi:hypothetical protein